jgi:hypothetical protein
MTRANALKLAAGVATALALLAFLISRAAVTARLATSVRTNPDRLARERDLLELLRRNQGIGLELALELLGSADPEDRKVALRSVAPIARLGAEPTRVFAEGLLDPDPGVAEVAARALAARRDRRLALVLGLGWDTACLGEDAAKELGSGFDPVRAAVWWRAHAADMPPQILPDRLAPFSIVERTSADPTDVAALERLARGEVPLGGRREAFRAAARALLPPSPKDR